MRCCSVETHWQNTGSHAHLCGGQTFGLTLNFNKGKTEALVSWGRKGRSGCSLAQDPRPGAAPTPCLGAQTCSSAASPQRNISHNVSVATTGYLQAVRTVFSRTQHPLELDYSPILVDGLRSLCLIWPNLSPCAVGCSEKFWTVCRGGATSVSDEKIRKEAKVPLVHVLVMARRLQLAVRISRGAPPALFALLQRDRSPWKRQVLVDFCRLRATMRESTSGRIDVVELG